MNLEALWGVDFWVPEGLIAGGAWPGNPPLEPKESSGCTEQCQHQPSGQLPLSSCKF